MATTRKNCSACFCYQQLNFCCFGRLITAVPFQQKEEDGGDHKIKFNACLSADRVNELFD